MRAIIFAGPSMPPTARPNLPGLCWRPPARRGDLYRAAQQRPAVIGLVDGYFDTVPSVWHKEILWALSRGIHVLGSSSVGALRAVELAEFGMRGVGKVYEDFRDGILQDDDEVALLHAPAALDYTPLTEAMVNMRATAARAVRDGVLQDQEANALLQTAKSLFYKQRTWDAVLAASRANRALAGTVSIVFAEWLSEHFVDQKRTDAARLLKYVAEAASKGQGPFRATFSPSQAAAWKAIAEVSSLAGPDAEYSRSELPPGAV